MTENLRRRASVVAGNTEVKRFLVWIVKLASRWIPRCSAALGVLASSGRSSATLTTLSSRSASSKPSESASSKFSQQVCAGSLVSCRLSPVLISEPRHQRNPVTLQHQDGLSVSFCHNVNFRLDVGLDFRAVPSLHHFCHLPVV